MKRIFIKRIFWLPLVLALPSSQAGAATLFKTDFNTVSSSAWPDAGVSTPNALHAQDFGGNIAPTSGEGDVVGDPPSEGVYEK